MYTGVRPESGSRHGRKVKHVDAIHPFAGRGQYRMTARLYTMPGARRRVSARVQQPLLARPAHDY